MKLVAIAVALALSGCGGSGGGSGPPSPPAPPVVRTAPLQFGYYGSADTARVASSVTCVHLPDWGDWTTAAGKESMKAQIIAQLQACKAAGLKAIVSTGFLTFTRTPYRYIGTADLVAFNKQLDGLGLSTIVIALYPLDEPDVLGISDAVMTQCFNETRAAWPGPAIAVVYGTHGTPGIAAADWVGHDSYREGPQFPALRAGQHAIVLPGGADPYRQDPTPFVAFANTHAEVALVWAFLYIDYTGVNGEPEKGIANNGMLAQYTAAGTAIKGAA